MNGRALSRLLAGEAAGAVAVVAAALGGAVAA